MTCVWLQWPLPGGGLHVVACRCRQHVKSLVVRSIETAVNHDVECVVRQRYRLCQPFAHKRHASKWADQLSDHAARGLCGKQSLVYTPIHTDTGRCSTTSAVDAREAPLAAQLPCPPSTGAKQQLGA